MKKIVLSIVAITILQSLAYGKDEIAATKLEAFKAKTGIVIVKGYTNIGTLSSKYGGGITVESKDFAYPSNKTLHSSGITITVKEAGGRSAREDVAFIDFDEIDSLIAGIDYISKATKEVTYLDAFEASYKTKGDLDITVFSQSDGTLGCAIAIGRIVKVQSFLEIGDLIILRKLLIDGKSKLKA